MKKTISFAAMTMAIVELKAALREAEANGNERLIRAAQVELHKLEADRAALFPYPATTAAD